MKTKRLLILNFIMSLALTACATGYHENNLFGGYSDKAEGSNVYRVTFTGNGFTDATSTYKKAMRRSAELTLQKNKRYFEVLNHRNYVNSSSNTYSGGVRISTGQPVSEVKFRIIDENSPTAYDARKVIAQTSE